MERKIIGQGGTATVVSAKIISVAAALKNMGLNAAESIRVFWSEFAAKLPASCGEVRELESCESGVVLHTGVNRDRVEKAHHIGVFEGLGQRYSPAGSAAESSENECTYKHTNEPTAKKINKYAPLTPHSSRAKERDIFAGEEVFSSHFGCLLSGDECDIIKSNYCGGKRCICLTAGRNIV